MPQAPGGLGRCREDGAPGVGLVRRARHAARAVALHHRPPVRLLLVAHPDHVDVDFEPENRTGIGQRRAPLAGPGLGRDAANAGFLVVKRLRHRGVRLVAADRAHAFVLVVDLGRRIERLLQTPRPVQRRRPPLAVDIAYRVRNLDLAIGAHLLADQRHREQGRQVVGTDRLFGARVQHRRRRARQVGDDVVPGFGHAILAKQVFQGFAHVAPPLADAPFSSGHANKRAAPAKARPAPRRPADPVRHTALDAVRRRG